mmetsp:Transcript_63944/g.165027  ORF Transcript_63944/g.165027 Transcript_63944/m.165027 type:complete len:312 (+) Transcript_63944:177-1112(+)
MLSKWRLASKSCWASSAWCLSAASFSSCFCFACSKACSRSCLALAAARLESAIWSRTLAPATSSSCLRICSSASEGSAELTETLTNSHAALCRSSAAKSAANFSAETAARTCSSNEPFKWPKRMPCRAVSTSDFVAESPSPMGSWMASASLMPANLTRKDTFMVALWLSALWTWQLSDRVIVVPTFTTRRSTESAPPPLSAQSKTCTPSMASGKKSKGPDLISREGAAAASLLARLRITTKCEELVGSEMAFATTTSMWWTGFSKSTVGPLTCSMVPSRWRMRKNSLLPATWRSKKRMVEYQSRQRAGPTT